MMARGTHAIRDGAAAALLLLLASCEHDLGRASRARATPPATAVTPRTPVPAAAAAKTPNPYQGNVMAINEGKRMYHSFNCVGCHAAGGGAIGPALMDEKWVYGNSAAAIHAAILDGRPNGMPSFRGKIQDDDAWKIAAYVRSLSGLDTRLPEGSTGLPPQQ
ncbi:c-type cytochrome [Devosia sp.]|uniref:c-type cytochrome n=1 Tax=Devosia sp. TaxID=1871048 RepID=UPI002FC920CB